MSSTSLAHFIKKNLELSETSPEFLKMFGIITKYLARGYGKGLTAKFHDDMSEIVDFESLNTTAFEFRKKLSDKSMFVANIRYYALSVSTSDNAATYAQSAWAKYSLSRIDAVFAWNSYLKNPIHRQHLEKAAFKHNASFESSWVSPQALFLRLRMADSLMTELMPSVKTQTYKKLRWTVNAHNQILSDLHCDLVVSLLQAYYQSLPNNFSREHQLNYLRATITSRVNNMNDYYGADKRQRQHSDGKGGYIQTVASQNQLGSYSDGDAISYEDMLGDDARTDAMEDLEAKLSMDELLDRTRGTKRGLLYRTISGRNQEEFTSWLRARGKLTARCDCACSWLASKSIKVMCAALGEWLEVSVDSIRVGLNRFAGSLGY